MAVLRPHMGIAYHVTSAAYCWERGGRITQLQYLLLNCVNRVTKYIQDILARCHHHVTFDLRTKKTSDCDRSNRMPT